MSACVLLSAPSSLQLRKIKLSQRNYSRFSPAATAATLSLGDKKVDGIVGSELSVESRLHEDCIAENPLATSSSSSSSSSTQSAPSLNCERGITFSTGPSFFRAQSSLGRDLAVLAAALYKRSQKRLRVLDAMAGCGVRALRYLTQSDADFVLVNDCNPNLHSTIVENMSRYLPLQGLHSPPPELLSEASILGDPLKQNGMGHASIRAKNNISGHSRKDTCGGMQMANGVIEVEEQSFVDDLSFECNGSNAPECSSGLTKGKLHSDATFRTSMPLQNSTNIYSYGVSRDVQHDSKLEKSDNLKWQVCHEEAARLFSKCNLNLDFYDFIDVDSFGSDSYFLGPALSAVRFGGLLFVTCTDGFSFGGHRPYNSLAQYGTFMRPMPYANELGLRMLMGAVAKEAAVRNMSVAPIFSVYAPHGPVFRVLLRASAGKSQRIMHYGFIYYCTKCGVSRTVDWEKLGSICCPCSQKAGV
ncbi:hypothetical protein L7F22_018659 [Adiantum nelumboides]|nr:hypothetical protein [Adiantum nelumboides]